MYNENMENDNAMQNGMGGQGERILQQEQQMQPPVDMGINGPDVVMEPEKKSKKWLGWVFALVGVAVIVAIVVVLVLMLNNNGGVTMDKVRAYCSTHNMEISEGTTDEPKGNYIGCNYNYSELQGAPAEDVMVVFAEYERPLAESENFAESYEFMKSTGVVLEETDALKKIYLGNGISGDGTGVAYYIIGEKSAMSLMASSNEVAKKALIEMGYPDRNWGTDEELKATSLDLQVAQRNTQRRDDMAKLATALTQYQANNRGQLPEGPSYWKGQAYLGCTDGNVACGFVQSYLNQVDDGTTNEFTSPLGEPYNLYITRNWVNDGGIDLVTDGMSAGLVAEGDGYTVSDKAENTAFVVVGGRCDDEYVVQGNNPREFAVLLKLENDGVYCLGS